MDQFATSSKRIYGMCERNNADHVGALNILARGHRVLACGENALATSMKQELVGSSDACLLSKVLLKH